MLQVVYGTCIFHVSCLSAEHSPQVCQISNPESFALRQWLRVNWLVRFYWRNRSQLLQSFLPDWLVFNLASCSISIFSFQRSVPRDPKIRCRSGSCVGILGVPQDRPSKFRHGFADKSDEVSSFFPSFSNVLNYCVPSPLLSPAVLRLFDIN